MTDKSEDSMNRETERQAYVEAVRAARRSDDLSVMLRAARAFARRYQRAMRRLAE